MICNFCIDILHEELHDNSINSKKMNISPRSIKDKLDQYIIGQEEAKRIVSVAVYNHLLKIHYNLDNVRKGNILLIGPTGNGKTYLVQILAKILNVPFTIADATTLTSAGYVGSDCETMFQPLIGKYSPEDISKSIICIDECFPGDTEIMTNEGFKRLDKLNKNELILQYNSDNSLEFVKPEQYIKRHYNGKLLKITKGNFVHLSTPDHDRVLLTIGGKLLKKPSCKSTSEHYRIPISGILSNVEYNISDELIKFMVSFCADGCIKNNKYGYISFKKKCKNDRFKRIIDNLGIKYSLNISKNYFNYYLGNLEKLNIFDNTDGVLIKKFERNLLFLLSLRQRLLLINELKYWDGYIYKSLKNSFQFFTSDFSQATLIQELCHISNLRAWIYPRKKCGYRDNYSVTIRFMNYRGQQKNKIEYVNFNDYVHCVEVPSGMIMIKQNGCIQISGNCDKKARKSGPNTSLTQDVSGEAVMYSLLKMIEGSHVDVPMTGMRKHPHGDKITIDTTNILFIFCGAFNGLEEIIARRLNKTRIGFDNVKGQDDKNLLRLVEHEDLVQFGLIPELVGRIPIIGVLDELNIDDLCRILKEPKDNIIDQYKTLLGADKINISFPDETIRKIAETAHNKRIGARGLKSVIEKLMMSFMYNVDRNEPKDYDIIWEEK